MSRIPDDVLQKAHDEVISETEQAFKKRFPAGKLAKEIALIAFSDMKNYVKVDEQGMVTAISLEELKAGCSRVIKKIRQRSKIIPAKGEEPRDVLEAVIEFELWDKEEALRLGAEYSGYKPAAKMEHDLSGSLMAAVTAYLSGKNDGPGKQD